MEPEHLPRRRPHRRRPPRQLLGEGHAVKGELSAMGNPENPCISGNPATFPPQLRYTVNTPMDYGSVSCSVAAEMTEGSDGDDVGPGRPCVYHIVPAGKVINNMEALVSQIIIAKMVGPDCIHCKHCCRSKWPQPSRMSSQMTMICECVLNSS